MTADVNKTGKLPRQARAKARVRSILTATTNLLKTTGTAGVTTTAIAEAAGVPVGSVYQYFDDKNDILQRLYAAAFDEIKRDVEVALGAAPADLEFGEICDLLLNQFWQAARAHPSFRPLTRWANREYSFVDVTLDTDEALAEIVAHAFKSAGIIIPHNRQKAVMRTTATIISAVIDTAIEEKDEKKAQALINELIRVLSCYLTRP